MKAGQEFRIVMKKKVLGDETFCVCDYGELANKVKVGNHIIVDFGQVCLKVIGFESEVDFLAKKQIETDVSILIYL